MKGHAYLALAAFVISIVINYAAVTLPLNGMTPPELSQLYPNLFVPANITFSIWTLIYTCLTIYVVLYLIRAHQNAVSPSLRATYPWFMISCILNAAWIVAWHHLLVEISVLIMALLLLSLVLIYVRIRSSKQDTEWWLSLPFSLYLGWICVALIANMTALLVHNDFNGWGLSQTTWTVIMMVAASAIGTYLAFRFQDLVILLVVIWALLGIYIKRNPFLEVESGLICSAAVILIILLALLEVTILLRPKSTND